MPRARFYHPGAELQCIDIRIALSVLWNAVNSALLKAARELLYQTSLLVAAMESGRREAAVSALVRIETLARGLRSAVEEQ